MSGLRAASKIVVLLFIFLAAALPAMAQEGNVPPAPPAPDKQAAAAKPISEEALAKQFEKKYGVFGYPHILFLDANGKERKDLQTGEEILKNKPGTFNLKLKALSSGANTAPDAGGAKNAGGRLEEIRNASLGWQLVMVFIGGLLLNLTPCVYPMIPITVGYFGAQSEGRLSKTFVLALFYVLGLALVYSLLGMFAAMTGGLFGSLMQSPWVVGSVAIVMFLFALSMMGLFTIQPPQALMSRSGAKKGALGALTMGALLGIVAAPCVGPVVLALLTYVGSKQDAALGFLLFFVLSLGLGLPYLLLGTFSGSIKSMPRSGPWLERSKKFFAVPIMLAALYYGYLAVKPMFKAPPPKVAAETIKKAPKPGKWAPVTGATIETILELARKEQRPVVVDFRAEWCLPCLEIEEKILSKPDVLKAAGNAVLLTFDRSSATG